MQNRSKQFNKRRRVKRILTKISILVLTILIVFFNVPFGIREAWASVVVEEYTSGQDKEVEIKSDQNAGQTFEHDGSGTYHADMVSVYMRRDADASSQTIYVYLRSTWGGADLCSGSFASGTLDTNMGFIDVPMSGSGCETLARGTTYWIRVDSSTTDGKIWFGFNEKGNPYGNGKMVDKDGNEQNSDDALFKAWGATNVTSLTTDKADYSSTETITVDLTAQNHGAANITGSTIDYVIFVDEDADNEPDAGETYITDNCAGSDTWSSGNYSHQTTGFDVNSSGGTNTDQWNCSNSDFPEITTYTVWTRWYQGGTEYDKTYTTFSSVPTIIGIIFVFLIGLIAYLGIKEGIIALALFPIYALILWFLKKRRDWLSYYLFGAFGMTLIVTLTLRHFGIDQILTAFEVFHTNIVSNALNLPSQVLDYGRLRLQMENGWSILKIGIECSALIEMWALSMLIIFYPAFSWSRKIMKVIFGLSMIYVINIARMLIIVSATYYLGTDYVFIAHALVGRLFFFGCVVILHWYLITMPTLQTLGKFLRGGGRVTSTIILREPRKKSIKSNLVLTLAPLIVISLILFSFQGRSEWRLAFEGRMLPKEQVVALKQEEIPQSKKEVSPFSIEEISCGEPKTSSGASSAALFESQVCPDPEEFKCQNTE